MNLKLQGTAIMKSPMGERAMITIAERQMDVAQIAVKKVNALAKEMASIMMIASEMC